MRAASIAINATIFLVTAVLVIWHFQRDGEWRLQYGLKGFRYFTVLSNVFCGVAGLVMALAQLRGGPSDGVVLLKYMATASVAVTFVTVMLFLGPTQGYRKQLGGGNLYMHLIGPLLAMGSYRFLEKREMTFAIAMLPMLPMLAYGLIYLYKVVLAPPESRWEDFYGFNRGGKWPLALGAMLLCQAAVCVLLWRV